MASQNISHEFVEPNTDNLREFKRSASSKSIYVLSRRDSTLPSPASARSVKELRRPSIQRSFASYGRKRPRSSAGSSSPSPGLALHNDYLTVKSLNGSGSSLSSPPLTQSPVDPPRPPREDYEWVWFPQGYWAEREVLERPQSRKSRLRELWIQRSQKSSITLADRESIDTSGEDSIDLSSTASERPTISEIQEKNEHPRSEAEDEITPHGSKLKLNFPRFSLVTGSSESLLDKTKRNFKFGLGKGNKKISPDEGSQSAKLINSTAETLNGVSETLQHQLRRAPCAAPKRADTNESRKVFGRAPWHYRTSHDSLLSTTSSVRKLLMGKTPTVTPEPEPQITDVSGRNLAKGESSLIRLSTPANGLIVALPFGNLEFLPSEATRVITPLYGPDPPFTPLVERPKWLSPPSQVPVGSISNSNSSSGLRRLPSRGDWPYEEDGKEEIPPAHNSIPDHLPTSPLCPQNPKHISGGTGICPMHDKQEKEQSGGWPWKSRSKRPASPRWNAI